MKLKYSCPFQKRMDEMNFIMCSLLMNDRDDYSDRKTALKAFCACQYFCPDSGRAEHTDSAQDCYSYHAGKRLDIQKRRKTEK